ncbi:MAG: UbiA family prenyltransferase [Candidatus Diapherotrites archaeon]|nr:UbiA family prenyltransferase [Candidatus Diapherotrites archaeon]
MAAKNFLLIIRPLYCIMAAFGVFIGYSVAAGAVQFNALLGIAMAVAFLVCGGGIAINDYFDRNVDKKLHPQKPIPSGKVKAKTALAFSLLLFAAANIIAIASLPMVSAAIALAFTLLFLAYSSVLAKAKYIGNFVVASGTAFTLVFGASPIGNYTVIVFLAASAFFVNVSRELIKDLEDREADRGHKTTLPMLVGEKAVDALIFIYYLLAMLLVYVPVFMLAFGKFLFIAVVSIANIVFLLSFGETVKRNYARAQAMAKAAMFIALLGFLAGAV